VSSGRAADIDVLETLIALKGPNAPQADSRRITAGTITRTTRLHLPDPTPILLMLAPSSDRLGPYSRSVAQHSSHTAV
jgi:hypothetical protein